MDAFNSYMVFTEDGHLIASRRDTHTVPDKYFNSLPLDIQRRAHVMLVLQEDGHVAKHEVKQPAPVPTPYLGEREDLEVR